MTTAEIITIGTELLLGETADTNTRFIARLLRALGVDLFRTQTIGDNAGRIAETVRAALTRGDIVITTGGLGPTVDDPTRQAIAEACDAPLEFHPELWEQITARIGRYGRVPTENQKRQAYIPKGAIVIENPVGTAPAFIIEVVEPRRNEDREVNLRGAKKPSRTYPAGTMSPLRGEKSQLNPEPTKVVIALPGVPREMETLLTDAVLPYLQKKFSLHEIIKVRTLHVSGLGEGMIDDKVGDIETLTNPTVGLTAHSGIVDIRIAAKAETETEAQKMIDGVEKDVRARLGNNVYGMDEDTLEKSALDAASARGWTVAGFESNLAGALLGRLSRGGHPAYRGGTSEQVRAEALAEKTESVRRSENASVALGVHLEQSNEKQEIFIVITNGSNNFSRYFTYGGHPGNAPRWAANTALDLLRRTALETG
jgi:nicotinamide-nucleotide amidase